MSEASLVLFIDLQPQKKIDLRTAARAAIAWADMVEDVGAYFDPFAPPSIKLESAQPGSQKLKAVIESLSEDPKTTIRTAIVSALTFLLLTTGQWTWEQVLEWIKGPDAPVEAQSLSDDERRAIAQEVVDALDAKVAEGLARRVYDELGSDTNVTGAGISGSGEMRPTTVVPRAQFPSQIFIVDETGLEKRVRTEEVDLVLFRPVLTRETNRRWGFAWPHGKMGATIKDQEFLERLASGQLAIAMSEGIVFRVQLEITEERQNDVWMVKDYAVLKVLKVQPPSSQEALELE